MIELHKKIPLFRALAVMLSVITLLFTVGCGDGSDESLSLEEAFEQDYQQLLEAYVETADVKGISSAVFIKDRELFVTQTAGFSDVNVPIDADMHFGIASITKVFIAALTLQLVEEGKLSLSDSIGSYLTTEWSNIDKSITVEQLLGHRSGIYNYTDHPDLGPTLGASPNRTWLPEELMEAFVLAPLFPEGSFNYSNTNYMLLGMLIEEIEQQTLGSVLKARITSPHDLTSISFSSRFTAQEEMASGWSSTGGDLSHLVTLSAYGSARWAAGGLLADAADVNTAGQLICDCAILSKASKEAMTNFYPVNAGAWTGYGLGLQRYSFNGTEFWGHTGGIVEYSSLLFFNCEKGIGISILVNQGSANVFPLAGDLVKRTVQFLNDQ